MEINLEEMKSVVEHEEIPKEEAEVKPVRALNKWQGDRSLAIGCHQRPKKRTQGNIGSEKTLAATRRGMTGRASLAQHKDTVVKDKAVPRTQKRWMFGKRHRAKPEGISGIRHQDLTEQLHLGSERTSSRIYRKALVPEIVKQRVKPSVRI
jgi:hypothetical protein